jgi:hypothetical protein
MIAEHANMMRPRSPEQAGGSTSFEGPVDSLGNFRRSGKLIPEKVLRGNCGYFAIELGHCSHPGSLGKLTRCALHEF